MKLINTDIFKSCAAAAALFSSLAASQAVLVAPGTLELAGPALGAAVPNFGGTVVADQTTSFVAINPPPAFTGTLRSTVVRTGGVGSPLDFYYQLANTTTTTVPPDTEIFRLALENFSNQFSTVGTSYEAFVVSNGLTGIVGSGASVVGTNAAFSADRDPGIIPQPGFGFDFGDAHFIDDVTPPANLLPGQTGNFLVIRTNATSFTTIGATISGAGTAFTSTFAPIPEPTTVLIGLALSSFVGCTELGRSRRRKASVSKA